MLTLPVPIQFQEPPLLPDPLYREWGGKGEKTENQVILESHRHLDGAGDRTFIPTGWNGLNVEKAEFGGVGKTQQPLPLSGP